MVVRILNSLLLACTLLFLGSALPSQSQDAAALLAKVVARARATSTMSASVTLTRDATGTGLKRTSGTFTVKKPNYAIVRLAGDDPPRVLASDGKSAFTFADETTYIKTVIDPHGEKIDIPWWNLPLRFFFTQSINPFGPQTDPAEKISLLPNETISGGTYRVLSIAGTQPLAYTGKLYINQADVLQRTEVHFGPATVFSAELSNIKTGFSMASSSFRFTPPQQAKLREESLADKLLALGQTAPDFLLPTPAGPKTSLVAQRKDAKATLVNFWYLNCPPCRIEFPEFEKLYEQFHAQGFNLVAIDKDDPSEEVTKYLRKAKLTFPVVLGGPEVKGSVFDKYRVETFPVTYLLDQQGKIVYRAAGGDPEGLRAALATLGFK